MALFGSKKKTVEKKVTEKAVVVKAPAGSYITKDEILRPRITEKSGIAHESSNVYTFEVAQTATKHSIARAIQSLYKVTPVKVRTVSLPAKNVFVRGRRGVQSAVKKAMVYLKKGDKIEIA